MVHPPIPPTIAWTGEIPGVLALLDQTKLPRSEEILSITRVEDLWEAIRRLSIRGAPAIGVAAGYGMVLGIQDQFFRDPEECRIHVHKVGDYLKTARPTAVNLAWAVDRIWKRLDREIGKDTPSQKFAACLLEEARAIHSEDRATCEQMGRHGAELVGENFCLITHCNTGSLATGGNGTALSVIFQAAAQGKRPRVFADETRPLLQGSRLTSWELKRRGIDVKVLCDGAAGSLLAAGGIDAAFVGADRIAANGDAANKVGTYSLAVLCREHGVPFYVVAPKSTFDLNCPSGGEIPIEMRDPAEVVASFGTETVPEGVGAYNPAFDVTPAALIAALITEEGILRAPSLEKIRKLFRGSSDTP